MTNRFKGLDLIDTVPEELWTEVHDIVQEAVINTIPKEKKCKKAKWLSDEVLQTAEKRREVKVKLLSCVRLCDHMDCRLLASSIHGMFLPRKLEQAAISFPRGSSKPWDETLVSCIAGRHFTD